MSAISSIPTMTHQNTVSVPFGTPPPFIPNDPFPSPLQYSNNHEQTLNSTLSEKGDDNRQKEMMQESMRLQKLQTDDPSTPQQYQFQGPMPLQLKYTFRPGQKPSFPATGDPDFDGRRLRRTTMRKTVDYNSAIIRELENRLWQRDYRDRDHLQPDALYVPHILPPPSYPENPFNAVTTRFVKTATNKVRCPVFCLAWTPEGRRLITGTSSGEFTLWNGLTFNFETILQAHDCPVRTMVWSNNELWMLTGDHSGFIKYWQSNMNNVKMYQGHREAVRGVSFSPTDNKFVSCSDDGTVRLWDFVTCNEERIFRGHGADVKCVHWHPYKSLVASGSKDNQQPVKLWDPRSGKSLATIHAHKSTVMDIKWNQNGNWVATASRDHLIKLYDIRNMNTDMQTFRGHKKETSVVAWHPQHEGLMCSGGSDGSILFWHVGTPKEVAAIDQAHDSIVWALAWHPLGHILCSGSNDHSCKFWTRNHPGDPMRDKYNLNTASASILGFEECEDEFGTVRIPGMGPEDKVDISKLPENIMSSIPGLDSNISKDKNKPQKKVPYAKPIPKNFQAQWNEQRSSKDILSSEEALVPDSKMLLNKLFEHAPGAVNVKDLKVDAMFIYGKIVPFADFNSYILNGSTNVPCCILSPRNAKENQFKHLGDKIQQDGCELERVISEGRDRVLDYVNSGNIRELNDYIPHIDQSEYYRRFKALNLIKVRGRQVLSQIKRPDRNQLKRSRDTSPPIPSKKWRSDGSDLKNSYPSGGDNYKDYGYGDGDDYRQSEKSSRSQFEPRGNDYNNYDDYDQYDNYDNNGEYANNKNQQNIGGGGGGKDNSWKDDYQQGGAGGRYANNERRFGGGGGWNKGGYRNDYQGDDSSSYRQNSAAAPSSHSNRDDGGGKRSMPGSGSNQQSDSHFGGDRPSRFSDADRGSRSKTPPIRGRGRGAGGYPRRPFGGGSRGGTCDSYSGSRFGGPSSDRYADNEDEYYEPRGGGGGNRDQSNDDYYKWQGDDRGGDDYCEGNEADQYDEYADDGGGAGGGGGSNYGSRGGRYQGGRGRRNFGRGGPSSWRGPRGKDAPRRGRGGRGGRRP